MSNKKTCRSNSPQQTEAVAEKIGHNLKGGETIELISDIGGGKTTFVRGLAKGFGSTNHVSSPTFTISKVYKNGPKEIHHFDFYRLPEAGLIAHELQEVVNDPDCTVVVEWAEKVNHALPAERLTVTFVTKFETDRELVLSWPGSLAYLTKDIK
ncbi:MAG: tRNA (adenosine(37)-N6)-threonylcarbamoyltransferase complex ATPase subunit type 1 TsaE [Candidatus Saccharibacteria bacterium]